MQVVCEKCRSSKNCENCKEMQRLGHWVLCATCYKSTLECEMCKILREVDRHIISRRQHEVNRQSREQKQEERPECTTVPQEEERHGRFPTEEEARANKLFFATAFTLMAGQAACLVGSIGYVIGKSIKRWRNDYDDDES